MKSEGDSAGLGGLVGARAVVAIPPVVARIFSGDSTSPLTREARMWCKARGCCPFSMVVGMEVLGATGGASSSPTKSEGDSAVLGELVGHKGS